jgi:hypothetical protein
MLRPESRLSAERFRQSFSTQPGLKWLTYNKALIVRQGRLRFRGESLGDGDGKGIRRPQWAIHD